MKCVLFLISLVLVVNVESFLLTVLPELNLGCFSNQPPIYPSNALRIKTRRPLSTVQCKNVCFFKGRKYAAMNPKSCFCFDQLQHQKKTACLNMRNGLGHLVSRTYYVGGQKGCYVYNKNVYRYKYTHNKNSPSYCIADCKRAGYKYAGLLQKYCTCTNAIKESELSFRKCNRRCSGAPGITCGGIDGVKEFLTVFPVV